MRFGARAGGPPPSQALGRRILVPEPGLLFAWQERLLSSEVFRSCGSRRVGVGNRSCLPPPHICQLNAFTLPNSSSMGRASVG
jgi:hypothetical protein